VHVETATSASLLAVDSTAELVDTIRPFRRLRLRRGHHLPARRGRISWAGRRISDRKAEAGVAL